MILHLHIHKLEIFGDAPEFKMVKDSIEKLSNHFNLSVQHPDDKIDKYILFEYTKGFAGKHLLSPLNDVIYEKKEGFLLMPFRHPLLPVAGCSWLKNAFISAIPDNFPS